MGFVGNLPERAVLDEVQRVPALFSTLKLEVDIVIERGAPSVVGVEVKAGATVRNSDFRGLRKMAKVAGSGVVLYDGESCVSLCDGPFAVPIRLRWESADLRSG